MPVLVRLVLAAAIERVRTMTLPVDLSCDDAGRLRSQGGAQCRTACLSQCPRMSLEPRVVASIRTVASQPEAACHSARVALGGDQRFSTVNVYSFEQKSIPSLRSANSVQISTSIGPPLFQNSRPRL